MDDDLLEFTKNDKEIKRTNIKDLWDLVLYHHKDILDDYYFIHIEKNNTKIHLLDTNQKGTAEFLYLLISENIDRYIDLSLVAHTDKGFLIRSNGIYIDER